MLFPASSSGSDRRHVCDVDLRNQLGTSDGRGKAHQRILSLIRVPRTGPLGLGGIEGEINGLVERQHRLAVACPVVSLDAFSVRHASRPAAICLRSLRASASDTSLADPSPHLALPPANRIAINPAFIARPVDLELQTAVPVRYSNSNVPMVKPTQDWQGEHAPRAIISLRW
jgi:hypothetical protein